ncbi:transposase [Paeniglutamicibacter kerguelensis]|uniref:transposase n=1 Tax=Paeniglutamicibacter kerguelensis TaxID=254788 RepID=UPI003A8E9E73
MTCSHRHGLGLPSRKKPGPSGRYLSLDERLRVAGLHLSGFGARSIAAQKDRSASTIGRELSRNGPVKSARGRGKYVPHAAQKKAELRGCQPTLSVKWSPGQIGGHLTATFPDRAEMRVCPETICQALYAQGRGHLHADLHQHLRTGRAVRRPRRSAGKCAAKIPDMVLISERPPRSLTGPCRGTGRVIWCWGPTAARRSPRWWNGKADTRCWSTCPTTTAPSPSGRVW